MLFTRTVLVHVDLETLLESAGLALVPPGHVHNTASPLFALVVQISPDGPFKESPASIAALNAVMLAGGFVPTHPAQHILSARFVVTVWAERSNSFASHCAMPSLGDYGIYKHRSIA